MIQVENLVKDYGNRLAVNNITFHAEEGEILGFLGPNGAGKTTTMRILSGFMPPTSGTARIGGFDVVEQSLDVRRIVGYLPETVPLYNDMTVYEYLKYMGDLRHLNHLRDRIAHVLDMVGMADRASGYIVKLSKGMRQRIGLAQALLHEPKVMILDEPTIGLDPGQVVMFRELIRELGRERTVLLSSHILPEVQQVCDRVLIISKGHIVAEDTPAQLQSRLTGSQRVRLEVSGEAEDLIPLLQQLDGVTEIQSTGDGKLELETLPGMDCRAQASRTVIQAGYDLLRLEPLNMSLEDIFLQLTREDEANVDLESSPEMDAEELAEAAEEEGEHA